MDIGPLVEDAASRYGVDPVLLLAMLQAESGLNRRAERWGVWPDVSFGYSQITVETAARYGIGDGSASQANCLAVREALWDRWTAIDVGARHLAGCVAQAGGDPLGALVVYNAGWLPPPGHEWWVRWAGNVASYRRALEWARLAAEG